MSRQQPDHVQEPELTSPTKLLKRLLKVASILACVSDTRPKVMPLDEVEVSKITMTAKTQHKKSTV